MKLKINKIPKFISLLILLSYSQWIWCQTNETGNPFIKNYTYKDYNSHSQNFSIVQDNRNVTYVGNFAGILEFDGARWNLIPTFNGNRVTILKKSANGIIYCGGLSEFGRLKVDTTSGELKYVCLSKDIAEMQKTEVVSILPMQNKVCFFTPNALYTLENDKIETFSFSGTLLSAFDVNGKIVVFLKDKGLNFYENKSFTPIEYAPFVNPMLDVNAILVVNDKTILCTESQGIYELSNNLITKTDVPVNAYLMQNQLKCATVLFNRNIAYGTERGGIVIATPDGKIVETIKKENGLANNTIQDLYIDNQNIMWVATDNGISIIEYPSPISIYDDRNGLKGIVNEAIRFENKLYVATSEGLFYLTGSKFNLMENINSACWSLEIVNNKLFIANTKGLYQLSGNNLTQLNSEFTLYLLQSKISPNTLYAGQTDGISSLNVPKFGPVSSTNILDSKSEIQKFIETEDGNLWMINSESNGLIKYNISSKSPENVKIDENTDIKIISLNYVDNQLLVSTLHELYAYNKNTGKFEISEFISNTSNENKFWFDLIYKNDKYLWVTEGDGKNLSIYISDNTDYVKYQTPLMQISENEVNSLFFENSDVWICSKENLVCFDLQIKKHYDNNFNALIRNIVTLKDSVLFKGAFYNSQFSADTIMNESLVPVLDYSFNSITVWFSTAYYNPRGGNLYQFYLSGFDKTWSEWTTETSNKYTNLPEGVYTFYVRARNIYGQTSSTASYSFEILTPIYKTWWAILIYIIVIVGGVYFLITWRLKMLQKEKIALEKIVRERTEQIENQKEELLLQSEELAQKNNELEKINEIVQAINTGININQLLQSLLDKFKTFISTDRGAAFVYDKNSDNFKLRAFYGYKTLISTEIEFTLNDIRNTVLPLAEEVYEKIFVIKEKERSQSFSGGLELLKTAKSIIIIEIELNSKTEGFVIIANEIKPNAYSDSDLQLAKNMLEHLKSAFIKAEILENLQITLQNLKETQEELIRKEKLASIGQLTQGIVDRIINPLNYINNFSQISDELIAEIMGILEKQSIEDNVKSDLDDNLQMLSKNIEKIMTHGKNTSRIVKGMEKLLREKSTEFVNTDINSLLESTLELSLKEFSAEEANFSVTIEKKLDTTLPHFNVLPYELSQALTNVINNSFYSLNEKTLKKATDYKPVLEIKTKMVDSEIMISIKDNGTGIPEKEQKQLFAPFHTTKPTAKGIGLGLFMTQDIINIHKGRIEVKSVENQFTEICIYLINKL